MENTNPQEPEARTVEEAKAEGREVHADNVAAAQERLDSGQSTLEDDAEQTEAEDSKPMPVDVAFDGKPDFQTPQETEHRHAEGGFYDNEASDAVNKSDDESVADFDAGDSNDLKTDDEEDNA